MAAVITLIKCRLTSPVSDEYFANKGKSSTHRLRVSKILHGAWCNERDDGSRCVANWLALLNSSAPRHFLPT
ncbi:hypothetical protein PgNI_05928 [Pyricularia grisea]|uniref:Uncharacterized protein n=1 Tax=Pyricularia grisea TaxID=148305 RepID=A0A6P8B4W5_PYRGI|nr:hypothetical protein PgNI_05928 [Pyricularia grisea]TLD10300.1 hypothetical protein PgNI_05928 [Pyricularia grisea]